MGEIDDQLTKIMDDIRADEVKKKDLTKVMLEKDKIGAKLDENLRVLTQRLAQLESIEYPGENEREMLVSVQSRDRKSVV